MLDLANRVKAVQAIGPVTATADITTGSVDRQGYESLAFLIGVGIGGITFDGTNKIDYRLQHSDDNSTWVDCVAADAAIILPTGAVGVMGATGIVRSLTAAHAAASITKVGYIGPKRYARILPDFSGTHATGTPHSVVAILSDGPIPAGV